MKRRQVDDIAREAWREIAAELKDQGEDVRLTAHNAYAKTIAKVKDALADSENKINWVHVIITGLACGGLGFVIGQAL